jgi:hypothetical protein
MASESKPTIREASLASELLAARAEMTFFRRECVARLFITQAQPFTISQIAKRLGMSYHDVEAELRIWVNTNGHGIGLPHD